MKEWHRTIILIILLTISVVTIIMLKNNYQNNFLDTL